MMDRRMSLSEIRKAINSNCPDARAVREWLKRNDRFGKGLDNSVLLLTSAIDSSPPLSQWEMASSAARSKHAAAVAKHAKALARLIESEERPYYPPALALFDEDEAAKIAGALSPDLSKWVLTGTRFDPNGPQLFDTSTGLPHYLSAANHLASSVSGQRISELLLSLARWAETEAEESNRNPRAKRPNTGDANRRALAVRLARHFGDFYQRQPNEIIACCVNLIFPDGDPPATEDLVRTWRGVR